MNCAYQIQYLHNPQFTKPILHTLGPRCPVLVPYRTPSFEEITTSSNHLENKLRANPPSYQDHSAKKGWS